MSVYDSDDWRAWVAAVRAAPDDDVVRMAAAGWLEERGEGDRAELIAVQCELVRHEVKDGGGVRYLGPGTRSFQAYSTAAAAKIVALSRLLLGRRFPDWWPVPLRFADRKPRRQYMAMADGVSVEAFGTPDSPKHVRAKFRRGFVDEAEATWDQWQAHGDAILAREPVRRVTLTTWPDLMLLAADPGMGVGHLPETPGDAVWLRGRLRRRWPQVPADGWWLPDVDVRYEAVAIHPTLEGWVAMYGPPLEWVAGIPQRDSISTGLGATTRHWPTGVRPRP